MPSDNSNTPFFPPWKCRLAPMGGRVAKTIHKLGACTLSQLESRFSRCLPSALFPKAATGPNSRDRTYTPKRTFWCFLWQCLNVDTANREVVRQLQALLALEGAAPISSKDGAFCVARQRLPEPLFARAVEATSRACDLAAVPSGFLQGRPIKLVDGTSVALADTAENQTEYPQVSTMKQGCSFPLMKVVTVFSLLSGAILAAGFGNIHVSEFRILHGLLAHLTANDIVIADRGFGNGCVLAWLQSLKVDFIARTARSVQGPRRRRLGKNDWLVVWKCPKNSSVIPPALMDTFPPQLMVRIVRGSLSQRGFRLRSVTVVTTLLDAKLYPAEDILRAYLRRWRLEMCLDDLKTTLGMNTLSCKSPAMARKEMLAHLIAHNLVRYTMAQAAAENDADLERISFKGTLDALRQFTHAMAQARSSKKRQQLWHHLLLALAGDLVPYRPARREPRAVKKRSLKYDRLTLPRHQFKDRPKRHVRRAHARLRQAMFLN